MRTDKQFFKSIALAALMGTGFATAGIAQDTTNVVNPETKAPSIFKTSPTDGEMNVNLSSVIEITFSSEMDEATINATTLLLNATSSDSMHNMHKEHGEMMDDQVNDRLTINDSENNRQDTTAGVNGTINYSDKVAVFTPEMELKEGTLYTFTVTKNVKNLENLALENDHTMSFTTIGASDSTYSDLQDENYNMDGNRVDRNRINRNRIDRSEFSDNSTDTTDTTDSAYTQRENIKFSSDRNQYGESASDTMETTLNGTKNMIDLGKAGQFVILATSTINNESASRITGRTGEGSVTDMTKTDNTNDEKAFTDSVRKSTSDEVLEWQSNQSDTTSPDVTEAIEDMMTAYNNVSMQSGNDSTSHMNENFQTAVLTPGVYEWSDSLHIESDVTLSGSADDVWIMMVGANLTIDENTVFTLTNGAKAHNVYWYVEGEVTIGKNANFEGIILSMNDITLEKGAKLNGRMFSQKSITLDDNTVTEPGSMAGQTTSRNR